MQRVPSIKHVFILQVKGLAVWSEPEVCSRLVEQTVWNRQPEPKAKQLRLQVNVPVWMLLAQHATCKTAVDLQNFSSTALTESPKTTHAMEEPIS